MREEKEGIVIYDKVGRKKGGERREMHLHTKGRRKKGDASK